MIEPALLPGHVCFWPEPDETGPGGGWCYDGTGYAEAPCEWWDKLDGVQRNRPTDCQPG
ncbi:hypothetical protein GCM10010377_43270 [Streptomyces viridiviolaceus]|uniref:Uncharacterized protein n=1 Tax=Streptomyces viridiviolaceus TaxID=68282 RepID=A0ABW2EGT1_9ACTN|nr:hypothetical protein [Streptomyces viridiviolaceus]GHB47804.1 hypothetical protein GCM10010377_43270 [Streptomyces viridiviolaceus]